MPVKAIRQQMVGRMTRKVQVFAPIAAVAMFAIACSPGNSKSVSGGTNTITTSVGTSTTTTSAPPATGSSPELVVCVAGNLYAIAPGSSANFSRPLALGPTGSFSQPSCQYGPDQISPDLSKWAETSKASDGSTVAGYVAAGTGTFVDVSGHSSSYSGAQVTDSGPAFDPVTGALWWHRSRELWSSVNGNAVQQGTGVVGSFTPLGGPSPVPVWSSPSGNTLAAIDGSFEKQAQLGILPNASLPDLFIGTSQQVTSQCLQENAQNVFVNNPDGDPAFGDAYQYFGGSDGSVATACPGVVAIATQAGPAGCTDIVGFISDSAFVCLLSTSAGTEFGSIPFSLSGGGATGAATPLTPLTNQSINAFGISPDGSTLWYTAVQPSGNSPGLYEVPTTSLTSNPLSFAPSITAGDGTIIPIATGTATSDLVGIGWYWKNRFYPGLIFTIDSPGNY